jgi:hypothetical protein
LRLGFASFSNSPRANHVTCVVGYTLEGAPRLVRHPAHDPALFVYILFFGRQLTDVTDELLIHHLAVLVEGGLDDVTKLVDRALRDQFSSVYALLSHPGGLCLIFFDSSCSVSGLVGYVARLIRDFAGLFCGLPSSVARTFGNLSDALASLLGGLASAIAHFSGSLSCALAYLLRSLSGTLGGFTRTFTDLLGSLTRTLADLTRCLAGAFAYLLGGLAGSLADIFHRRLGP